MRLAAGDLWKLECDARCITTNGYIKRNGAGVMGRGCALEATKLAPELPRKLGNHLRRRGNVVGVLHENLLGAPLIAFPVKNLWNEAAYLPLIARSCEQLMDLIDHHDWKTVLLPRPGSGNGRLSWEAQVQPLVTPLLDDRVVVVHWTL